MYIPRNYFFLHAKTKAKIYKSSTKGIEKTSLLHAIYCASNPKNAIANILEIMQLSFLVQSIQPYYLSTHNFFSAIYISIHTHLLPYQIILKALRNYQPSYRNIQYPSCIGDKRFCTYLLDRWIYFFLLLDGIHSNSYGVFFSEFARKDQTIREIWKQYLFFRLQKWGEKCAEDSTKKQLLFRYFKFDNTRPQRYAW